MIQSCLFYGKIRVLVCYFYQYVALNRGREKGKPQCKLSYKLFKEEDIYVPLLEISPYPIMI